MARSRKKTPIRGLTSADSEKEDKRRANRKLRRSVRETLSQDSSLERAAEMREVSNVWSMGKEGKYYLNKAEQKDLRK